MELGIGTCGWHKNSYGIYTIDNAVKPQDYLFLRNDTIVKNDVYKGTKYSFKVDDNSSSIVKYTTTDLNERKGPGTNYPLVNTLLENTAVTVYEINGSWARIEQDMWVSNNFLTTKKPQNYYKSMEVYNCETLNVRQSANNGLVVGTIPVNTVVSVIEVQNDWTRIGQNKWVYNAYLK